MAKPTKSAGGERFSTAVVESVAERVGVDPIDLDPPLYRAIDPDALDELLTSLSANGEEGSVSFTYLDFEITVRGDGTVHLDDATNPAHDFGPN